MFRSSLLKVSDQILWLYGVNLAKHAHSLSLFNYFSFLFPTLCILLIVGMQRNLHDPYGHPTAVSRGASLAVNYDAEEHALLLHLRNLFPTHSWLLSLRLVKSFASLGSSPYLGSPANPWQVMLYLVSWLKGDVAMFFARLSFSHYL